MKQKMNVLFSQDTRGSLNNYTREEAVMQHPCGYTIKIYGDKVHWMAFQDNYVLTVVGPKMFWKKQSTGQATFKNGKLYGDLSLFRDNLLKVFQLDWILKERWTLNLLGFKKDLWKDVFTGRITNPEKLCKTISKRYFKGAYSYKSLRGVALVSLPVSLWDIYYHTVNPEEGLKVFLHNHNSRWRPLEDVLRYCKILNTKMDPRWSDKRLSQEHQRQIEQVNALKMESISPEYIADEFHSGGLSLILNERECFLEGCSMHNCVHTCYWKKIKRGDYLIAKGMVNGEYVNLGITVNVNDLYLDQVHTIYNGSVISDTRTTCFEWIDNNKEALMEIVYKIRQSRSSIERREEFETIPF